MTVTEITHRRCTYDVSAETEAQAKEAAIEGKNVVHRVNLNDVKVVSRVVVSSTPQPEPQCSWPPACK